MEQHASGQAPVSDGADNTVTLTLIPIEDESVAEDAKQTHPHHEEDTDDDDDIKDPDYNPFPENEESLATVAGTPELYGDHLEDEDVDENLNNNSQKETK